ncbi:hypothetical protein [Mycobacterium attenuatum]|uniref:hypothetical protein n=1 Tax=Mycobacterium attenuatum TaxID=2341086 RepID=UPI000F26C8E6|nr:hypothetical protein [Mycobacterium attenuatum]VBA59726.1 hypothetical protein LAUMK41_03640 [Mycobacterium attenuatum]
MNYLGGLGPPPPSRWLVGLVGSPAVMTAANGTPVPPREVSPAATDPLSRLLFDRFAYDSDSILEVLRDTTATMLARAQRLRGPL